jgi:hypothetical protein
MFTGEKKLIFRGGKGQKYGYRTHKHIGPCSQLFIAEGPLL